MMSLDAARVVWSEGLFLRPHHFQQQERFLEATLEQRVGPLSRAGFGFTSLTVDRALLLQGKVHVSSASGLLPDGTPFAVPSDSCRLDAVDVPVMFHGHNNLGMAVANSIAAAEAGATILDACARGFGAGAGNTQLEVLVPVLERLGYDTGIDFYRLLDHVRGAVLVSMCVNVDTGTSWPPGVLILRSSNGPTVVRSSSPICGMTL